MTRRKREIVGLMNERDNSIFDSASQTPLLRMHSATASVANASPTRLFEARGGRGLGQREVAVTGEYAMVYWAKRSCDPDAEIPFMKLVGDLQLKLGAPHELMMLGSHPLTRKGYEVFIGVPQRELLDLFDGFTEIQENELPDKLVALVIREDGFDERFPAIAAKRAAAAKP
jgi:hypothetical protein